MNDDWESLNCHTKDINHVNTRLFCLSTEIICQQVRVLPSHWPKHVRHCGWIHRGHSYDKVFPFSSQINVRWQNRIIMTLLFIIIFIHLCWWIFALISKQALLKMWFYYLCHAVNCARPVLMLSSLCGCQYRGQLMTQKNLLQRNQTGPCLGNPRRHK